MALESPTNDRFVSSNEMQSVADPSLPLFNVDKVELQFSLSAEFVAAQVANNVLVLAIATGRILRIDLDNAADIDDIDLPKRPQEIGLIRHLFLDPSASHLIITTSLGENYYLHTQSRQPKPLPRLKGVAIESIGWNPSLPTASTREILIGSTDGKIYETSVEPTSEFYRREEKYVKTVHTVGNEPVTGLWSGILDTRPDYRRVIVSTPSKLYHYVGKVGKNAGDGSSSIFSKFFENESPTIQEGPENAPTGPSALAFKPTAPGDEDSSADDAFAWLTSRGVRYGTLTEGGDIQKMGTKMMNGTKFLERPRIPPKETSAGRKRPTRDPIKFVALTQWHMLCYVEGRIVAINRLNERIVFDQEVLDPSTNVLGLYADLQKNTFWLFTPQEIFEIAAEDEDRDVWKIMLKDQKFDAALRFARGIEQKDAVATASGDYLMGKKQFIEAASVYGESSKAFEEVALTFIDNDEQDALRRYLLTKLGSYKKSFVMQRVMITSWLVELYMAKLNNLDDTITTKAELVKNASTSDSKNELAIIQKEFRDFVAKFHNDLDRNTTYSVISSHGREDELLAYAKAIADSNYVLSYWIQRERWTEALDVLKKQDDPEIFYKYSSVLMTNVAAELVDILMRQSDLEPRKIIPALLNYTKDNDKPISQNQAARYLLFCINQIGSEDPAVHNTLISIYASHPSKSESALLSYLESQSNHPPPSYDVDFALRLCIQHDRVNSCVHIYSLMSQFSEAINLALKHDEIELASIVADRPADTNPALRKKLWLAVAKKVIGSEGTGSVRTAIDLLKRCDLLRIEDLIPFFPDFVVIDDFKEEICSALESYSRHIDQLKTEMDDNANTASSIQADIKALNQRYAIVMPGEKCRVCGLPLLSRQFFVFPSCQHGFHSDCLGRKVVEGSGITMRNRIRELQTNIGRGVAGPKRDREVRELDELVGKECVLCNEYAIKLIEAPFVTDGDDTKAWEI